VWARIPCLPNLPPNSDPACLALAPDSTQALIGLSYARVREENHHEMKQLFTEKKSADVTFASLPFNAWNSLRCCLPDGLSLGYINKLKSGRRG
jgi:hypothetical protein